jgi:hypothetical protein
MGEMKTQVIQLDPHDDVTSVRDKISWAKTARILLVYPRRSRLLERTLDLRLLQRYTEGLGSQLAIVAPLEDTRQTAQKLGILVFKTAAIAKRETWQEPRTGAIPARRSHRSELRGMRREAFPVEGSWRNRQSVRLLFFSLAILAVLVLLLLFLPSAKVEINPETRIQSLSIPASASPNVTTVNLTGSLPARLTFSVLELSRTAPVTGSIIIAQNPSAGMVRFRNLNTGAMDIPSGTIVITTGSPPVRFATTAEAVIPAGLGKSLDVPVQAVDAGSSGNLPADSLVALEGSLGASLAVTNPSPTAGGSDRSAPIQTADDRTRLHDALVSEILENCKISLPQSIAAGGVYFPDTITPAQTLSETYFPADGQTGETLSLSIKLQCQAQYATATDINTLAGMALDANLPGGFEPVSNAVTASFSAAPVTDIDGTTHWKVQAQRLLHARIDPLAVTLLVQGRSRAQAGRRLTESFRLAAAPTFSLSPSWWPWLPVIPFRITVSSGE